MLQAALVSGAPAAQDDDLAALMGDTPAPWDDPDQPESAPFAGLDEFADKVHGSEDQQVSNLGCLGRMCLSLPTIKSINGKRSSMLLQHDVFWSAVLLPSAL